MVFLNSLMQAIPRIRRATTVIGFRDYSYGLATLSSHERKLDDSNSTSLQACKIVQVTQEITVPLPYNVTYADFAALLKSLLSNQKYL